MTSKKFDVFDIMRLLDHKYHEDGLELMPDSTYDFLKKALRKRYRGHPYFNEVGAPISENAGEEVKLPIYMASLTNITPRETTKWAKKLRGDFIILPKLDGLSCLLKYEDGFLTKAYSRGNGIVGRDITHKVMYMTSVPRKLQKHSKGVVYVRGEIIMHTNVFRKKFRNYSPKFNGSVPKIYKNGRGLAIGAINAKKIDPEILKELVFIPYTVIHPRRKFRSKLMQLHWASINNFISILNCGPVNSRGVRRYPFLKKDGLPVKSEPWDQHYHRNGLPGLDWFKSTIAELKEQFQLDIDGLVITRNEDSKVQTESFAIKLEREDQETKKGHVGNIEWNSSYRGNKIPVLVLRESLNFNGVEVQRIGLTNAATVKKFRLNIGDRVKVVRAGDVIPYLVKSYGTDKAKLPKRCEFCNHRLQFDGTNLFCDNATCEGRTAPMMEKFFAKLNSDAIGPGTVRAFIRHGANSIPKVLALTEKKIASWDGFGLKKAKAIIKARDETIKSMTLADFMGASGIFSTPTVSLDYSRLQPILNNIPKSKIKSGKVKINDLLKIKGIGKETAQIFVNNLPDFNRFYAEVENVRKIDFSKADSGALAGKVFVFTNWRSPDMERMIARNGGRVSNSVTYETTACFPASYTTKKARDAIDKGVKIVPPEKAERFLLRLME